MVGVSQDSADAKQASDLSFDVLKYLTRVRAGEDDRHRTVIHESILGI